MASIQEIYDVLPCSKDSRMTLNEICAILRLPDSYKGKVSKNLHKLMKNGEVAREKLDSPYYPWGYFLISS